MANWQQDSQGRWYDKDKLYNEQNKKASDGPKTQEEVNASGGLAAAAARAKAKKDEEQKAKPRPRPVAGRHPLLDGLYGRA